jgi:cell division protein FtsL
MTEQTRRPGDASAARAVPWRLAAGVLLMLVMASAFAVQYAAHRSRELFGALEENRKREEEIQIEWRKLLLERSTFSSHARVEAIADSELKMHAVEGDFRTVVIE